MKLIPVFTLLFLTVLVVSQPAPREQVGRLPGGGFLLNSGWRLQPAGRAVPLDTFPMSAAISPDGRSLLVLNGGYMPPSVSVVDLASEKETSRTPVADGWLGLAFSPKGDRVYVGGGSKGAVFEFAYAGGVLTPARTFQVTPADKLTSRDFIGDVAVSPDGRLIYAAELYQDSVVVINPQSGMMIERFKTGRRPYRILFHPDGKSLFVTSWADGTVGHYQAETGRAIAAQRVGPHPTDMVFLPGKVETPEGEPPVTGRIFVAASNTNSVYSIGLSEAKEMRILESISTAIAPRQPLGMTPSALALSRTGKRLFIVCSDANAVAVADLTGDRSRVAGFVPSGWYPTAVRELADGRLAILNGRGGGSRPNPLGPNPLRREGPSPAGSQAVEYVGRIQTGSATFVDPFDADLLERYSRAVLAQSAYRDSKLDDAATGRDNPIPARPGGPSPIQHVIYIIKENRTYDQVLGDMKEGNGDPALAVFGEKVTPNQHKLAREFVLFDNFYVNSDVSADGHNWSTAAIAPDYVQKLWPNSYGGRRKHYDYEGQEPASRPPAGYLWTNAAAAGLSIRSYGVFVTNRTAPGAGGEQVAAVGDPALARVTNPYFRGFDPGYKDIDRAAVFLKELAEFEKTGQMPRLILMRLGNDHTSGAAPGKVAPLPAVADNDYALGLIVEGVTRSRFWPKAAIFVLEDDAQDGADHVDSHRSPAFVISPYVRRKTVDGTMYNTMSILRTIELILGLRPMTQFDAAARPLSPSFHATADTTPYSAEKPRVPLDERNPAQPAAAARMDFREEDRIDDDELNGILRLAIRGTEPPAPVRSFFPR